MCTPLTLCWNPPSGPSGTAGCTARSARFASLVFKNWKISRVARVDSLFICKHRKHTTEKFCTSILWICFDLLYICALFFQILQQLPNNRRECDTVFRVSAALRVYYHRSCSRALFALSICGCLSCRRPSKTTPELRGSRRPEGLDEALKSLYLQHHHPATVLANGTINDFLFEIAMLLLIL